MIAVLRAGDENVSGAAMHLSENNSWYPGSRREFKGVFFFYSFLSFSGKSAVYCQGLQKLEVSLRGAAWANLDHLWEHEMPRGAEKLDRAEWKRRNGWRLKTAVRKFNRAQNLDMEGSQFSNGKPDSSWITEGQGLKVDPMRSLQLSLTVTQLCLERSAVNQVGWN